MGSSDQASTREFDQWVDWSGTSQWREGYDQFSFFIYIIFYFCCLVLYAPHLSIDTRGEKWMDKSLVDEKKSEWKKQNKTQVATERDRTILKKRQQLSFLSFFSLAAHNIFTSRESYYYRSFFDAFVVCLILKRCFFFVTLLEWCCYDSENLLFPPERKKVPDKKGKLISWKKLNIKKQQQHTYVDINKR